MRWQWLDIVFRHVVFDRDIFALVQLINWFSAIQAAGPSGSAPNDPTRLCRYSSLWTCSSFELALSKR